MPPIDIKQHLQAFHEVLEGLNTQLCMSNNGFMLFPDLSHLQNAAINCISNNNSWQYSLSPMRMKLPYTPKTIPNGAKDIEIQLEVSNTIIIHPENEIKDPFSKLNFDIIITSKKLKAAWHLDKQSQLSKKDKSKSCQIKKQKKRTKSSQDDKDGTNKYIHPEYHIAFGGNELDITDAGQLILLTSPRLMHPPMDVILGIDFIINQFIPYDYAEVILTYPKYKEIVSAMKQLIWRPYFVSIAHHFQNNLNAEITFPDANFSNKILGVRQ